MSVSSIIPPQRSRSWMQPSRPWKAALCTALQLFRSIAFTSCNRLFHSHIYMEPLRQKQLRDTPHPTLTTQTVSECNGGLQRRKERTQETQVEGSRRAYVENNRPTTTTTRLLCWTKDKCLLISGNGLPLSAEETKEVYGQKWRRI